MSRISTSRILAPPFVLPDAFNDADRQRYTALRGSEKSEQVVRHANPNEVLGCMRRV